MPQDLVLFSFFVNYLNVSKQGMHNRFAGDTKLEGDKTSLGLED